MSDSPDKTNTIPKPRRRCFQFGLRTLFVLMTLVAIAGGWFAMKLAAARRQEAAVNALVSMGAGVCYDYEMERNGGEMVYDRERDAWPINLRPGDPPPSSPWLRDWLGVDFFHRVVGVNARTIDGTKIIKQCNQLTDLSEIIIYLPWDDGHGSRGTPDFEIRDLAALPKLRRIYLKGCSLRDESDLAAIARQPNLEEANIEFDTVPAGRAIGSLSGARKLVQLRIVNMSLAAGDLESLRNLPNLRKFKLGGSVWDAATLGGLRHLPNLEEVEVGMVTGGDFTAEQVTNLGSLPSMKRLRIWWSDPRPPAPRDRTERTIERLSLEFLRHLVALEELHLNNSQIGDNTLKHIAGLRNLRKLHLEGCVVSSAGIAHLTGLTNLESLELKDNDGVDDRALKDLQKLKALRNLGLFRTKVSEEGEATLKKTMPGLSNNGQQPAETTSAFATP